ncbi:aspartate-semialdehyde dehydrogenase [Bdellovibrionota bacterium]
MDRSKKKFDVAIVGATGLVGLEMLSILEERNFPVNNLYLFASDISAGEEKEFHGKPIKIQALNSETINSTKVDISFWSIGAQLSQQYIPHASKAGWISIDNSSAFRMEKEIPLAVPEVNPEVLKGTKSGAIIANPNCSTIQLVQILKPIDDAFGLKRVVVSTYQSVSGSGKLAMKELEEQTTAILNLKADKIEPSVYPHQIGFAVLPHIDDFLPNGNTKEEMKMVNESRKILSLPTLPITATCVRVPVFGSHSESVNIEVNKPIAPKEVRSLLSETPGVKIIDDPSKCLYPLNTDASGKDETFVGRIRVDDSVKHGVNLWVVSDNLRKGAALNAIQIGEYLISHNT